MLTRWSKVVDIGGDRGGATQHSLDWRRPLGATSEALFPAVEFEHAAYVCWPWEPRPLQERAMIELLIDHPVQSTGNLEVGPQSVNLATELAP